MHPIQRALCIEGTTDKRVDWTASSDGLDALRLEVFNPQRSSHVVNGVSRERDMMNGTRNWKQRNNRGAYVVAKVERVKGQPGQDAFRAKKVRWRLRASISLL